MGSKQKFREITGGKKAKNLSVQSEWGNPFSQLENKLLWDQKKKIHNANRNRIERKLDTGTGPGIHLLAIRRLYWPNCEDGLMIK